MSASNDVLCSADSINELKINATRQLECSHYKVSVRPATWRGMGGMRLCDENPHTLLNFSSSSREDLGVTLLTKAFMQRPIPAR